jgi:small subunit ribosomal protein S20
MPNTKSAERRVRSSARRQVLNRGVNTRLHTLEKKYLQLLGAGKKEDAAKAFQTVSSALDKAAKTGTVPKARASRKKSRLALQLNKLK